MKHTSFCLLALFLFSCTNSNKLGSKENPIKFLLIPAQDMQSLVDNSKILESYLIKETGLEFSVEVPINYVAVVEAFGSKKADVAIINTFGYILAHDKYAVEAKLKLVNRGRDEYQGQIIIHKDSPIKSIKDIDQKRFAFVDPASTSGYLLPKRLFKQENIKLKEYIFSGRHDTVVTAVYQKQVDAGATFYTPPDSSGPQDARTLVKTQFPDVFQKIKILQLTGPIPNDPVAFRKDLSDEIKNKIINSLIKYVKTDEGAKVLRSMYYITDFKTADDKDYNQVRTYLKDLGQTAEDFVKK